jgi:hypothetical protein
MVSPMTDAVLGPGNFCVADLDARGDLHAQQVYSYDQLERIPHAADLIAGFSTALWRSPEAFDLEALLGRPVNFRWRASAPTAGIATLRCGGELSSLSLLVTGHDSAADQITLAAFQRHLLTELHDTGFEPAFDLIGLAQRPLVATINFKSPPAQSDQLVVALADRCFAASYFRYQRLV